MVNSFSKLPKDGRRLVYLKNKHRNTMVSVSKPLFSPLGKYKLKLCLGCESRHI